ncbi:hypothetical protein OG824_01160 [Streptomyces prunicolor]|uniref:hypothetical protein n=1 Tax=Streptomyces prunicolor TaxID=67348 RepID=UPI0022544F56|nr:hypothetical protein [Streptomyces prunicolor]MCX5233846.1 hypothetical protein [Streptomyces prunicolor]
MGTVHLGRAPRGREVAVKVVREHFGQDARYRARFRREVAAARTVTGTFTATLPAAAPEAEVPWPAMEYLPGLSLRRAVETYGGLPPKALRLPAGALAEALADIHRADTAHRDPFLVLTDRLLLALGEARHGRVRDHRRRTAVRAHPLGERPAHHAAERSPATWTRAVRSRDPSRAPVSRVGRHRVRGGRRHGGFGEQGHPAAAGDRQPQRYGSAGPAGHAARAGVQRRHERGAGRGLRAAVRP